MNAPRISIFLRYHSNDLFSVEDAKIKNKIGNLFGSVCMKTIVTAQSFVLLKTNVQNYQQMTLIRFDKL